MLIIAVLSVYFLADLPRIRLFAYRLVPDSRRPRAILIGDEILPRVGGYVLGNFLTSLIAGLGTYLWMISLSIPYRSCSAWLSPSSISFPSSARTAGGAVVTLTALTVSLPVALATLGFYIACPARGGPT